MNFKPSLILRNPHLQTIYPVFFRKVDRRKFVREKISTWDEDFLHVDHYSTDDSNDKCVILIHGMEGHSQRKYMLSMTNHLLDNGCDCFCVNLRGCSGEPNRKPVNYNAGQTEDLDSVVKYVKNKGKYKSISLIGFSLGGNLTLKYLGEHKFKSVQWIDKAATASVPIDLKACSMTLEKRSNVLYLNKFVKDFKEKVECKGKAFLETEPYQSLPAFNTVYEFDAHYTAPLSGFKSVEEYYQSASAKNYLHGIKTPTLFVSSYDDPFLNNNCYFDPNLNPNISCCYTQWGGHMGFMENLRNRINFFEKKVLEFFES